MVRLVGTGEKGFGQKRFLSRIAPQEEKGTCMWLIFYPQSVFHGYPIEYKMGTEIIPHQCICCDIFITRN
jgi:hypothetical protein